MKSGATRKILLAVAAGIVLLSTGAFTAGTASAGPYPQAEISRTLFINPFDYTAGPAYLPYTGARKIYLTAGTYHWSEEVHPTWPADAIGFSTYRNIFLRSNWYYWRCWMQTELLSEPALGVTGVASHCTLTPVDGSTPTAYLTEDPNDNTVDFELDGLGDYRWYSDLLWLSNP